MAFLEHAAVAHVQAVAHLDTELAQQRGCAADERVARELEELKFSKEHLRAQALGNDVATHMQQVELLRQNLVHVHVLMETFICTCTYTYTRIHRRTCIYTYASGRATAAELGTCTRADGDSTGGVVQHLKSQLHCYFSKVSSSPKSLVNEIVFDSNSSVDLIQRGEDP